MTTTQAPPNGHCVSPPPFPVEHPAAPTGADLPTDEANNNELAAGDEVVERQKGVPITPLLAHEKVPASAYHVPPKLFAPKADSFRNTIPEGWSRTKLPDRCQFMFSDGRQCTMARSDIHPSLCVYHSDREEQLFGDPGQRCEAKTLDFPELHSACRDLSTAVGVNRALAQVFRMLARGRISRQEAATFAKLAQLLLQSISAMRADEFSEHEQHTSPVVERQKGLAANVYPQDELRGVKEDITPLLPHNEVVPSESGAPDARCPGAERHATKKIARWGGETGAPDARCPGAERHVTKKIARWDGETGAPSTRPSARATARAEEGSCAGWGGEQREPRDLSAALPLSQPASAAPPSNNLSVSEEAVAAVPDTTQPQPIASNSRTINTSADHASNSPEINTYEISELEPFQNQHLQKNSRGRRLIRD